MNNSQPALSHPHAHCPCDSDCAAVGCEISARLEDLTRFEFAYDDPGRSYAYGDACEVARVLLGNLPLESDTESRVGDCDCDPYERMARGYCPVLIERTPPSRRDWEVT